MKVNPINVIKILLATFEAMNIAQTPVNNAELELADKFETILINTMQNYNEVEMIEEETLDFQEPFRQYDATAVEDTIWVKDTSDSDSETCSTDDQVSYEYKKKQLHTGDLARPKIIA